METPMTLNLFLKLATAVLTAILYQLGTTAVAMTVQPVIVDLSTSGSRMSAVVTVENTFQTPLPVELRATEADLGENGLVSTQREATDLLIFPPQALIPPGRTQTFRIQWVGDPALAASKHFFLTVAQLPVKLPAGQSAVQILYNFQVIVSIGVPGVRSAIKVSGAETTKGVDGKPRLTLMLHNDAASYGYLSDGALRIVQTDEGGKEVFRRTFSPAEVQQQIGYGLVGANQKRRLTTSIELPSIGGKIEAEFTPKARR
jgi:fimbrial chaperone protein